MLRNRIYGYKARRRQRVFPADLSLIPAAPFSQGFFFASISISQLLVQGQCWCPGCSYGCVSRVCLRSPSFAQGNFSSVSQGTGNEGAGVQRGEKLMGWEGDAGCLYESVGTGLGGQRDGIRQITATNFLGHLMSSLCGHLACHAWHDLQTPGLLQQLLST